MISIQNQHIDFWFTHLQMEYEDHIWWFRRVHEYCSYTKYEGLTPNRNRFIDDLVFWFRMGFSYTSLSKLRNPDFDRVVGQEVLYMNFWNEGIHFKSFLQSSIWLIVYGKKRFRWFWHEKNTNGFFIFFSATYVTSWQPPIWSWRYVIIDSSK